MSEEKTQKQPQATSGGEDVRAAVAEFQSAQAYRRWVARGVVIAILVVVLVGIYRYYSYGKGLVDDLRSPETQRGIVERAQRDLLPDIREEAQRLYDTLGPKIVDMAKKKAEEARPEIVGLLEKQGEILQENLNAMLQAKMEDMFRQIIEEHQESLQASFPELADEEKLKSLVALLWEATSNAALTVFTSDERLGPHIEVLKDMDHQVRLLPVREETDEELLRRLGVVALELLVRMRPAAHEVAPEPAAAE